MAEDEDPVELLDAAACDLLTAGPMRVTELLGPLDRLGLLDYLRDDDVPEDELAEAVFEDLLDSDAIWVTSDEVLALYEPLLERLVLTHRLTADDCRLGEVPCMPDLVILEWAEGGEGLDLPGGGNLVYRPSPRFVPGTDNSTFAGPDGWLDGFQAGDLIAFTCAGGGARVERVGEPADDVLEAGLLRDLAERCIPNGSSEEAVPLLLDALVADAKAFRQPVRPVEELLQAAGFERRGSYFGRAGERWESAVEKAEGASRRVLEDSWGFDYCCHEAFSLVGSAFAELAIDGGAVDAVAVAGALRHGTVAVAFAQRVLGASAEGDEDLRSFAAALIENVPPKRSAAALLVLAMEAERRGDPAGAEDALRRALKADPAYGPAAVELAHYEIDRGDIHRALALLNHPEAPPDLDAIRALERLRSEMDARRGAAGRNDRCPCGSGRKFKVCCQRNPTLPLSNRLSLLLTKLKRFGCRPHRVRQLFIVALQACDPEEPDPVTATRVMAEDPIVADVAVFEGGIAAAYLHERGHLLPLDERELLQALVGQPRRLWEVTAVVRGTSLTLRDTATGEELEVKEHLASLEHEPGELLLSRVAEVDGHHVLVGAVMAVPLRLRSSALSLIDAEPDADDLARWYGQSIALPSLVTRDGEPVVLCRAELTTGLDHAVLQAALDVILDPEGDGTWLYLADDASGDEQPMRGTVRLEDGRLCIDTNTEAPMEHHHAVVTAAVPEAVV
ncbi:MAG: SEC-C metal-binding domain-containing protein, partial [Acidimicrobiales bacterium]